ncbi:hypothetical protein H0H87_003701 [Tephrocybe sp. NHM501043]|nr:hypothetical protein H0H87_003701 [Tephrocybe sp. NHM501043]
MIAFANYVDGSAAGFPQSFSEWLKARTEIWNQIKFLRKTYGSRLNVFAPVNDLSSLSKSGFEARSLVPGKKNDVAISGGQVLGDEYSDHVVKNRTSSTLLKSDQWIRESTYVEHDIRGAINFRSIPNTNIYALGQPSMAAIDEVVDLVREAHPSALNIAWVTLREEPIVYINGAPYCLRREGFSLRNMKDYGGISASRLEVLEDRLKDDVIAELREFGGRVLLHTETTDGTVVPVWEEVTENNVTVMKDVMSARHRSNDIELKYHRVPITAERPPDFADLNDLIDVVLSTSTNLLRVIRKGPMVKHTVDDAIDQCSAVLNLREAIEELRNKAEGTTDEKQKKAFAQKGLQNLRRYFELIVFQSYLQTTEPDTRQSFEIIHTFQKELFAEGIDALKPLERADPKEGMADPDEVTQVVMNRTGSILSASTILKSDFFLNLQKMSLPERIEGSPNFRRVPLTLRPLEAEDFSEGEDGSNLPNKCSDDGKMVCGSGMPTVEGYKRALERVNAGPGGKNMIYWTSLREASGQLATGVTTAVVEGMEYSFKKDVLRELRAGDGRILLHDELEDRPGTFSVVPVWETVTEDEILTPKDVIDAIRKEGYRINYARIAITDEQAPLPDALWQLYERVRGGMSEADGFVFNCQMGRGRTTTGMIAACLISSTMQWDGEEPVSVQHEPSGIYDSIDGLSEEEAYLQGEYKTILQLVGVLSHGKVAKRLADRAIDLMQDVQNLRKAIYEYRYGTLIVFANYLIETKGSSKPAVTFPEWLHTHREITKLLERKSLD